MTELFELFKKYHAARNIGHLALKIFDDESGYVTTFEGEEILSFHSLANGKKKLRKRILIDYHPRMEVLSD